MQYRVVAISEEVARLVRSELKSPKYGHPAQVEVANGYGPCRLCLQTFAVGLDQRILFTYDAFEGVDSVPSPGPIFIHQSACERFEASGFPPDLRRLPLLFEGYGRGSVRPSPELVVDGEVEATIERLFAEPGVDYIQLRNAEAGCFMARIERQSD